MHNERNEDQDLRLEVRGGYPHRKPVSAGIRRLYLLQPVPAVCPG